MNLNFNEKEILGELDMAFNEIPSSYYPTVKPNDIKYNFFLDLEHGYFATAGNRIHLYADSERWAIVFEKSEYQNRDRAAEIELIYVGNCINYIIDKFPERNYISNTKLITLIDPDEFHRIENKKGDEMETFELIGKDVKDIKVRDTIVDFDKSYINYQKIGIKVRSFDNPKKLIGFEDLIRYLHETNPGIISATQDEIREHIPNEIPKIMTINEFHFNSVHDKEQPPSQQETYQLIAKVLTTRDSSNWKPTEQSNNYWKNWISGHI